MPLRYWIEKEAILKQLFIAGIYFCKSSSDIRENHEIFWT